MLFQSPSSQGKSSHFSALLQSALNQFGAEFLTKVVQLLAAPIPQSAIEKLSSPILPVRRNKEQAKLLITNGKHKLNLNQP